ncbi:hypothetical protein [Rhodopirellula sp. MGV]|uniref:hypothetical protein n=1 Tax=Rhodopirellula sp. MGV TaxID=2023130 RepID=UPI000B976EF9|nr:hypothetical protein [Rhodopirellula sp. MGV]OYP34188.1 hypothetical protein CGZ80_16175 [Rhodopirellula sp. MGV]PNY33622.1 hypothetical protein C2E31_27900 [Rhodopirellula baltica]
MTRNPFLTGLRNPSNEPVGQNRLFDSKLFDSQAQETFSYTTSNRFRRPIGESIKGAGRDFQPQDEADDDGINPAVRVSQKVFSITPATSQMERHVEITFDVTLTNVGNEPLVQSHLTMDFDACFGNAYVGLVRRPRLVRSDAVRAATVNPNYDGTSLAPAILRRGVGFENRLAPNEAVTFRLTVEADPQMLGARLVDDQLVATAKAEAMGQTSHLIVADQSTLKLDLSDHPSDGELQESLHSEQETFRNPTPQLAIDKQVLSADRTGLFTNLTVQIQIKNTGHVAVQNIRLTDDSAKTFGDRFDDLLFGPFIVHSNATKTPRLKRVVSDGELFDGVSGEIEPGQSITLQFVLRLKNGTGQCGAVLNNQLQVSGEVGSSRKLQPVNRFESTEKIASTVSATAFFTFDGYDSGQYPTWSHLIGEVTGKLTPQSRFGNDPSRYGTDHAIQNRRLQMELPQLNAGSRFLGGSRPGAKIVVAIHDKNGGLVESLTGYANHLGHWQVSSSQRISQKTVQVHFQESVDSRKMIPDRVAGRSFGFSASCCMSFQKNSR